MDSLHQELPSVLRLSPNKLSFAHYSAEDTPAFEYAEYPLETLSDLPSALAQALCEHPRLSSASQMVEVVCDCPVTLVPMEEFQEENCEYTYRLCFGEESPVRVFYDSLGAAGIIMVFGLPESVCQCLESQLGTVHYLSKYTSLVRHLSLKSHRISQKRCLYALVSGHHLDVLIFQGRQLQFINRFEVHSTMDEAYYTFNVAQHLNLALQDDEFYVIGLAPRRAATIAELANFAKKVYPVNPTAEFNRHVISQNAQVPYDLVTFFCA